MFVKTIWIARFGFFGLKLVYKGLIAYYLINVSTRKAYFLPLNNFIARFDMNTFLT